MKLKLLCIGKIKDSSLHSLIQDYSGRVSYDAKLEILEIKDSTVSEEGKKVIENLDKIKDNKYVFVLSEEGKELTSLEFSERIKRIVSDNKQIVFIIGGPFGLSEEVKKKADLILSVSKMTFTHEMVRLFLLEQIYRAISIIKNKNYHK
jgi:23S rRNA (pseudouridine1915-N3)-methyltransferase